MKPRQPLFELAICAALGIIAADWLSSEAAISILRAFTATAALCGWALAGWLSRQGKTRWNPLALWIAVAATACFWHSVRRAEDPGRRLATRISPNGCALRAVGVVDEEPNENSRFRVRLEWAEIGGVREKTSAKILVQWPGGPAAAARNNHPVADVPRPAYGDRIEIAGSARNLSAPRNPGEFDEPAVRRRQGIYSQISVRFRDDARVLEAGCGNPAIALSLRFRHWMERTMSLDLEDSPESSALIQSMVLGSRGNSMEETRKLFQYTGTLHLFAVSGMNIAMLAATVAWLLQACRVPRRGIALFVIPTLWAYCFVTGLTASSLRATLMATVAFAGIALDRPALSWNMLGASLLAIVAWDSNQLFTPGLQLSFALVAILLATAKTVQSYSGRLGQPDPFLPRPLWSRSLVARSWAMKHATEAVAISTVAWIGSMPLMIFYFHLWSPSTVPANLIAGLIAWIMLMLGIGSVLAGTCCTWLAVTFNNANWFFSKALLVSISALAALPGSHLFLDTPSLKRPPRCEIEIFDFAGGGAIHLRTRERRDWLIDCGSASAFKWTLASYLQQRGVNALDGLILTHGDSGHLGGALDLMAAIPTAELIDSPYKDRSPLRRKIHSSLAAGAAGKAIVWRGDTLALAPGISLHVLFPQTGLHLRTADDKALILRLDVNEGGRTTRTLFMSDAGFATEHWLLENAPAQELRCDILVKGMHAADLSGTPEFLNAAQPELLVTSGADFPPAQRVKEEWASSVEGQGIRLLRQDRTGAVRITIGGSENHGSRWTAQGYRDYGDYRDDQDNALLRSKAR